MLRGTREGRRPADPGGTGTPTAQGEGRGVRGHAAGGCQRGERPREGGQHDTQEPRKQGFKDTGSFWFAFEIEMCVRGTERERL